MAQFIPDDIDFTAYERDTECKAKVRRASDFSEDLDAEFEPRSGQRKASMFSTKLRDAIEFRPGEVTCWAGFNGHRKSMFTGQVALDLCVQRERTLIVSLEMKPRKTLARICRQAAARAVPTVDERRQFMRWTDDRLWLFDHEGRLLPDRAIAVCRYFAKELHGRHVVIDSLMKVVQSEESLDEQKRMVGDLCDIAKETDLHVHLVAHCKKPAGMGEDKPPTKYDIRGSAAISDQCSNVILVWQDKAKRAKQTAAHLTGSPTEADLLNRWDAILAIDKQRNGEVEGKFGLFFDDTSLRFTDSPLTAVQPYDFMTETHDVM
jgi:twinkle protein